MSSDQDPVDIYFSSPEAIKEIARTKKKEGDEVEHNLEDTPRSFRTNSMSEEYVCSTMSEQYVSPKTLPETNHDDVKPENQRPRRKKLAVQNEYDEDHYSLAVCPENDSNSFQDDKVEEKQRYVKYPMTMSKKMIVVFCFLLVVFFTAGLLTGLVVNKEGENHIFVYK